MRRRELLLLLSTAMTAPRFVLAQQGGRTLGILDPTDLRESTLPAIREGLEDAGYSFPSLVAIEYRGVGWTDSRFNP